MHPTRAATLAAACDPDAALAELREVAEEGVRAGKCVAVGEAGVDFARLAFCDAPTQAAALAMQLALAADLGLPLFLHLREADEPAADGGAPALDALCAALASAPPLPRGGVVHSFDGSAASLARVLALPQRLDVGVNGCSLRTATNLSVAATIPLDRLLLESDAPWCGLRPEHASAAHAPAQAKAVDAKKWAPGARVKGRNEPAAVADVAVVIASVRGVGVGEVAAAAWANSERLFFSGGGAC